MTVAEAVMLALSLVLFAYLFYALLRGEKL